MNPSKTPAAPPPPGVTPNFTNPSGSEYEIYSVSIALCVTASLVLLARLYTRAYILRVFGLDDGISLRFLIVNGCIDVCPQFVVSSARFAHGSSQP